jgi:hypothetical protein
MLLVLASSMFIHHDMHTHEILIYIYPACMPVFYCFQIKFSAFVRMQNKA